MKAENNEEDLEEAPFEPKLTRSRVKELRQKQHMVRFHLYFHHFDNQKHFIYSHLK